MIVFDLAFKMLIEVFALSLQVCNSLFEVAKVILKIPVFLNILLVGLGLLERSVCLPKTVHAPEGLPSSYEEMWP